MCVRGREREKERERKRGIKKRSGKKIHDNDFVGVKTSICIEKLLTIALVHDFLHDFCYYWLN